METVNDAAPVAPCRGRILVVDDHQDMLQLLAQIVDGEGYQASLAGSGMEALWCAAHQPPDLILLDVRMPGMNGLEVARALKRHAATASIPIIIVSAADSPEDRIAGFEAGAVDFIAKPFVDDEVLARIDTHMQMSQVRADVLRRHQDDRGMTAGDDAASPPAAAADQILEELLSASAQAALLLDTQGQPCYVNPAFVQLTGQELPRLDAVLLQQLQQLYTVQTPELRCLLPGLPLTCTAYVARLPLDPASDSRLARIIVLSTESATVALRKTQDSALFHEFANFATQPVNTPYPGLQESIRTARARHELRLLYQPIYDLVSMRPVAVEALLRWQHPQYGLLVPQAFLEFAEETGAILEIGRWVLDQAVQQLLRWQQTQQAWKTRLGMAINVSPLQFWQDSFVQDVADSLRRYALPPADLMIEVAASTLHEDLSQGIAILHRLQALGVSLTLDRCRHQPWLTDGLARLPVDIVKLDPALWQTLDQHGQAADSVRDLVDLSHAMQRRVTACGIELPAQLSLLNLCHCDMGQGYLLGRPAAAEQLFATDDPDHG